MSSPRQFVLQACDHGGPVFEARFSITELDELRTLVGIDPDDDPEFEGSYALDAAETAAITARFGVAFDPEGARCTCGHGMSIRTRGAVSPIQFITASNCRCYSRAGSSWRT